MDTDYNKKITTPNQLLLFEINDRVTSAIDRLSSDLDIASIDIEALKIDKESLNDISAISSKVMVNNLSKKIDVILKTVENED